MLGEAAVRNKLAIGLYANKNKKFAEAWLEEKRVEQEAANQAENAEYQRRAIEAAEMSAKADSEAVKIAKQGEWRANIALAVAALSLLISAYTVFWPSASP